MQENGAQHSVLPPKIALSMAVLFGNFHYSDFILYKCTYLYDYTLIFVDLVLLIQ